MAATKKSPVSAVQIGDIVLYSDRSGEVRPAMVMVTPATFDASKGGMEPLGEDELTLAVFRLNGAHYTRRNVPLEGGEAHKALVAQRADYDAWKDGHAVAAQVDEIDEALADDQDPDEAPSPVSVVPQKVSVRSWRFRD